MAASHDYQNWRDGHSGDVDAEDAFMAGYAAGEVAALGLSTDCKDGTVITVCKASPVGDQVIPPVVLRITDDAGRAADAIPTDENWEERLAEHYDTETGLVLEALRVLPMATRHRLLAKLLIEHRILLRLPGDNLQPTAAVMQWSRSKDGETWAWRDLEKDSAVVEGYATEADACKAAVEAGYRVVVDRSKAPWCG